MLYTPLNGTGNIPVREILARMKVKCDVGETTYFSEIAQTQTLDNLRREGVLDLIQYLERLPEKHIPRKQELIQELKARGEAAR